MHTFFDFSTWRQVFILKHRGKKEKKDYFSKRLILHNRMKAFPIFHVNVVFFPFILFSYFLLIEKKNFISWDTHSILYTKTREKIRKKIWKINYKNRKEKLKKSWAFLENFQKKPAWTPLHFILTMLSKNCKKTINYVEHIAEQKCLVFLFKFCSPPSLWANRFGEAEKSSIYKSVYKICM